MKAYKGFDKDLKCRGFQYEVGKTYEEERAELCSKGFHACEAPLDVLRYYHPKDGARFCSVDLDGVADKRSDDSKVAGTKITVGAEIGLPGLVKAHIEYVKSRTTTEHTDPNAATAGYRGAATAGSFGAATAGYRGAATAGEYGLAVCNGGKVRGGMDAVLVIAERDDDGRFVSAAVAHVDGEKVKPDTWYKLVNGEFVEVDA